MSRISPEEQRRPHAPKPEGSRVLDGSITTPPGAKAAPFGWRFWAARAFLIACAAGASYTLSPFGLRGASAAGVGFLIALVVMLAELRLRRAALSGLLGAVGGTVLGIFAALLVTLVISRTDEPEPTKSFLEFASLLAFGYLGLALGSGRGGELRAGFLSGLLPKDAGTAGPMKLLDTSVLIDGRIADICNAQFLEGVLGVPQFVLHELQMVADSADPLKRQRGRRGLEVLERIQKMPNVEVRILEDNFSQGGDVDHKLVELAGRTGAKIVTNDFNLNKVATVQGFSVLNVNQLANALRPAILPGETMRVLILREGKEANQGVAYLDDGTMVVVDGGRRMINKSVDIIATSVHQTTAGKMIFGRLEEKVEQATAPARKAAAAAAGRGEGNGGSRLDATTRVDGTGPLPEQASPDRETRPDSPESEPG